MKIIFFSRERVNHSPQDIERIFTQIEHYGLSCCINFEVKDKIENILSRRFSDHEVYGESFPVVDKEAVILCYGGDGTILDAVNRLEGQQIPIVGINSGRVGFLACAISSDIEQLFKAIVEGDLSVEQRDMLSISGDFLDVDKPLLAANELSVHRFGATMIATELLLNGELVATYHGDGVVIATPTGSTAYSLSAGGPILVPACSSFVVTPLAPHNMALRPLVIPATANIVLRVSSRDGDANVSIDNRTYPIGQSAVIEINRAKGSLYLSRWGNKSFYDTLRDKMMWGLDLR
ncbi:MAG: NAD(+)/NADH kinase [Rikenellaceae bacterium]